MLCSWSRAASDLLFNFDSGLWRESPTLANDVYLSTSLWGCCFCGFLKCRTVKPEVCHRRVTLKIYESVVSAVFFGLVGQRCVTLLFESSDSTPWIAMCCVCFRSNLDGMRVVFQVRSAPTTGTDADGVRNGTKQ